MDYRSKDYIHTKKRERAIDREFNTALFLLRAAQLGLSIADLEKLSVGMVLDMIVESGNDNYKYPEIASAEDIARFKNG